MWSEIPGVTRTSWHTASQSSSFSNVFLGLVCAVLIPEGHIALGKLAQALIHEPNVLVLDEPTIGLDPRQIREIRSLVKELAGERTVILSTHILQEVVQICQKVVIINEGRVVVEDEIENLTRGMSLEEVFMRAIGKDRHAAEEASV